MDLELVGKTWAHKKNSSYEFSKLLVQKCLSRIYVYLFCVAS